MTSPDTRKAKAIFVKTISHILENFDSYLALSVAASVSLASFFSDRLDKYLITATLSVLALASVGFLRDRIQRNLLTTKIRDLEKRILAFQEKAFADDFFSSESNEKEIIADADNQIILIQETGRLIAETCRRELVNFLKRNGAINMVVVLDRMDLIQQLTFRNANLGRNQMMQGRHTSGLEMIEVVASEAGNYARNLQVRFFPYPIDITAIMKDPNHNDPSKASGIVRLQGFRVNYDDKLDFQIDRARSRRIFAHYQTQLEQIWASSSKCIFITGQPRIGKSMLLKEITETLEAKNIEMNGFLSIGIMDGKNRIGFKAVSLSTKEEMEFAKKNKNGKYDINQQAITELMIPSIEQGLHAKSLIIIDEIGALQLSNQKFKDAINEAINNHQISILGVLSADYVSNPFSLQIANHIRTGILELSESNKDVIQSAILSEFSHIRTA